MQVLDRTGSSTKFVPAMETSKSSQNTLPVAAKPQTTTQMTIPTIRVVDVEDAAFLQGTQTFPEPSSQDSQSIAAHSLLEEDMDRDPQAHFLSPVQMYETWDDSDDEEDDRIQWDAGIMDFAAFTEDQKRAKDGNQPLSSKWDDLLSNQAAAYKRSVQRTNDGSSEPEFLSRTSSGDSLPDLTPDTSPRLNDDLEYEDDDEPIIHTEPYRTVIVTPDSASSTYGELKPRLDNIEENEEDEDPPLSFYVQRNKLRRRQSMAPRPKKLVRPGLRGTRTLSGQWHVWRRPSWDIHPVLEDASGEAWAEKGGASDRDR